ncbi:hypothetical protein ACTWP5_17625 [Streptomyces sp. 4N509B]|uniref:hypothetical protein n=1 Tax=Streptomyces sp. 4N509B TaxID=3457413 RepID=UPI003FD24864
MNRPRRAAVFGFAADPRALADLRAAPQWIRELALLHLQDLVHGEQRGVRLGIRAGVDLSGCRRLYVDPDATWRIVYQERRAPPGSARAREVFLLAVGQREAHAAYNAAARRLGRLHGAAPSEHHQPALARPHLITPAAPAHLPPRPAPSSSRTAPGH